MRPVFGVYGSTIVYGVYGSTRVQPHVSFVVVIAMCSCGRNTDEPDLFQSWANSMIISPWGKVMAKAGIKQETIMQDIDLSEIGNCRSQLMYST